MMNEMMKMTLIAKVTARMKEVQEKLAVHGYPAFPITPIVTKELKAGRSGEAHYYDNTIKINEHYMVEHEKTVLEVTVAHEICHLYQHKYMRYAKQAHGPEFRYLMRLIGLPGKTYHCMQLVNGPERKRKTVRRWIYKTADGSVTDIKVTTAKHNKMRRGIVFLYRGQRIEYTGKYIDIKGK